MQVLFCKLCKDQRDMYRAYLNSQEVDAIFAGNRQALAGIDILRKICNHPDLLERTKWEASEEYGKPEKSGKLTVLMKVGHALPCGCRQLVDSCEQHLRPATAFEQGSGSMTAAARLILDAVQQCQLKMHTSTMKLDLSQTVLLMKITHCCISLQSWLRGRLVMS